MRSLSTTLIFFIFCSISLFGNGVGIVDANEGVYLKLVSGDVEVTVENQVAIIKTTQTFLNNLGSEKEVKYAFPLTEDESAISLRWKLNNQWFEASFSSTAQDTTLPGGGGDIDQNLKQYLGKTPLYFKFEEPVQADSLIVVELTYVKLLHYELGNVFFSYPNDYSLIQNTALDFQQITFTINSERTIENLFLLSHAADSVFNDGNNAYINYSKYESLADRDYEIKYILSLSELGLFGLSTFLTDSLVPDNAARGFFVFVAEPDPSDNAEIINKVFTLIVDRSGSMGGDKIIQARSAASFIVQNLNEGDKFNIVDFSSDISAFQPNHVDFNPSNESSALAYISTMNASGSTNISGAFDVAIPQFSAANDSSANIIIFFTDGQATAGITNTEGILSHINDLVGTTETNIAIFTFGIGNDANEQLLTLLASQNNGLSAFVGSNELEEQITNFYLKIRNPVLLNTQISFSPNVVSETYPFPLPNLYKGQQMIVAGRYNEAAPIEITLNGEAFSHPISYKYQLSLADTALSRYRFLTKVWAKRKIENLLIQYFSLDAESTEAKALREEIITISIDFGVISPFTSFIDDYTNVEERDKIKISAPETFQLLGNYPNPFNPGTSIRVQINADFYNTISIKIYNSTGQLIRVIYKVIKGPGVYDVYWDGLLQNGKPASSGTYFYLIDFGKAILGGKMILLK